LSAPAKADDRLIAVVLSGGGSRAAAETHDGVRQELADADAALLSNTLNATLVRWITEMNFPGAAPPTVWRRAPEQPDLLALAELDKKLFEVGYEPTEEHVRTRFGEGYRRIQRTPPQVPGGDPTETDAVANPAFAEDGPEDRVNALAERLARDGADAQAELLDAVRAEVEAAASFADLEMRLARLSGALPVRPLAAKLAPAFAAAYWAAAAEVAGQVPGDD
jgi:phage gp29-like protein